MHILITGGAGFAGSNLAIYFKEKYPNYEITCLDNLKRRGSELNLGRLKERGIKFIHADIRNAEDLSEISYFDVMIDASAEPSVLAGINSSILQVVNNNLFGTINCLEIAKKYQSKFIFLSTSRIYPINPLENCNFLEEETRFVWDSTQEQAGVSDKGITEDFTIIGSRSFYGATKLSSELLITEYNKIGNLPCIINRCGVLTGPYQMGKIDQGVAVLWMAKHFWKGNLSYFGYGGEGKQLRDILHIHDLCELLDYQIHNFDKLNGEVFNVGGGLNITTSLQELTKICENITGNKIQIEKVAQNRTADLRIYITDNHKIHTHTNWTPKRNVENIMQDIFNWISQNEKTLKNILQ